MASKVLERAFRSYNRRYFKNSLPKAASVEWEKIADGVMGYQIGDRIAISKQYRTYDAIWRLTLLHEMCHLKHPGAHHGKKFQTEMLRLAKLGAFKGLW